MKLKKHLKLFVRIFMRVLSRRDVFIDKSIKKIHKRQLKDLFNKEVDDKRLSINNRQLSKVIKKQETYDVEIEGGYYFFKKTQIEENEDIERQNRNLYK